MEIYTQLTSQGSDKAGNYHVASLCLNDSSLLPSIVNGLENPNNKIVIDCAEVLTEVAKERPACVAPFAPALPKLLGNKNNRARWEGMHCLALIAGHSPQTITPLLEQLVKIFDEDESIIVRDYTVDALGNYAKTGKEAAQAAYPLLVHAASVWGRRHARQALEGLANVLAWLPNEKTNIRTVAGENLEHEKGTVRTAAKLVIGLIDKMEENK